MSDLCGSGHRTSKAPSMPQPSLNQALMQAPRANALTHSERDKRRGLLIRMHPGKHTMAPPFPMHMACAHSQVHMHTYSHEHTQALRQWFSTLDVHWYHPGSF